MGIIVFTIAAILSMPKQILGVYLGVLLKDSESGTQSTAVYLLSCAHPSGTGTSDKEGRIVSNIVLAITFIITAVSLWYILRQMNKVKPDVIYKRRKAR
jgi:phage major head subunit gpT-like protein